MGIWDSVKSAASAAAPWNWGDESESTKEQRQNLNNQGGMASWFADQGQNGYFNLGGELGASRDYLRRVAGGQESLSREQLRQGMQQATSQQRSMAAGAAPQNQAMAARQAMMNTGRAQMAMSGQAATAGIQERAAAQQALAQMLLQQRAQDVQVALGSRQNATSAFSGVTPEGSFLDKYGGAIVGAASLATKSDERLKKDIRKGDDDANNAIKGLGAYVYKYKDEKHGKGARLGIMAQELEKAGLGHAVIDEPDGKAVHGGHLSTANTAMIAALGRRLEKIEKKGGK